MSLSRCIEAHRREVQDAILDATGQLAAEHGLLAVTMSQIAETTAIGRATLSKYFPDVESLLVAWHERQLSGHMEQLAKVRDQPGDARDRLEAVLEVYASIQHALHAAHDTELSAHLHGGNHVALVRRQLHILSGTCSLRRLMPARCGATWPRTSSRPTASTPSQPPAPYR